MSAPGTPHSSLWKVFLLGTTLGLLLMASVHELFLHRAPDLDLYREVRNLVTDQFVGEVDPDELVDEALRGMLGSLDPYSRYYSREEIARLDRETTGTFTGLGVVFKPPIADRQVLYPVPGSPAAGKIDVGDRLLTLDGEDLALLDAQGLQTRLAAADGREVEFEVEARSGKRRVERIAPATVLDPTVRHGAIVDPERSIAYLAILAFSHETPTEFDAEIAYLESRGMKALVIDLRGNPGGVLTSATRLANRFIAEGDIVVTRGRKSSEAYEADPDEATLAGLPLVLLVDDGSASASEVLAGAVQDYRVGAIVGTRTFGKGMVQTLQPYGDRAVVKLTTSLYYTPANRQIDTTHASECDDGIEPDLYVPIGPVRQQRLRRRLGLYSPPHPLVSKIELWEAEEGLELIAPWPDDPQRDAAIALLSGRLRGDDA
jgi:carboxyl-terminal processing protease